MNITTIRDNLVNTIAGKEKYLAELRKNHSQLGVSAAVASYVEINIDELRRILQDVESCVAEDVEQSWRDNPDRMGGQFTQDEIDNASAWR